MSNEHLKKSHKHWANRLDFTMRSLEREFLSEEAFSRLLMWAESAEVRLAAPTPTPEASPSTTTVCPHTWWSMRLIETVSEGARVECECGAMKLLDWAPPTPLEGQ